MRTVTQPAKISREKRSSNGNGSLKSTERDRRSFHRYQAKQKKDAEKAARKRRDVEPPALARTNERQTMTCYNAKANRKSELVNPR